MGLRLFASSKPLPRQSDPSSSIAEYKSLPKFNLLPNSSQDLSQDTTPTWYTTWLISHFATLPPHIFDLFHSNHTFCTVESHWEFFTHAYVRIASCIIQNNAITIDETIKILCDENILAFECFERHLDCARYLVFTMIGLQSMLFVPSAFQSVPQSPRHLCITEQSGCCGYTHASLSQSISICSRESLSELLMGFGVLLPTRNLFLDDDEALHRTFQQQVEVDPNGFDIYSLRHLAGIKIKWTDALSCHLELNTTTKEVSLFRFPSFCRFSLTTYDEGKGRGVLHACATTSHLRGQWASETEVNQLLLEVLLSYRLLFGQTKRSRALFDSVDPFQGPKQGDLIKDPLLSQLCSKRNFASFLDLKETWGVVEKETYYLPQDFPILRYRIVVLQKSLAAARPRTWLQLWRDNRNSANWMTFWAVIVFGLFGSLMALLQVILQFVQLWKA